MKKFISVLLCVLFALVAFFPVGTLVTYLFGCKISLISVPAFAIVGAVVSLSALILSLVCRYTTDSTALHVFISVLSPFSIINSVLILFECNKLYVLFFGLISIVCCTVLSAKFGRPLAVKVVALVLAALLVLPAGFFTVLTLLFHGLNYTTVIKTVKSPNGTCYAEIIDSDQGALGGATYVDVHKTVADAVIFRIEKKTQRVYEGNYGEYNQMEIHWKDDSCLVIDSVEYEAE